MSETSTGATFDLTGSPARPQIVVSPGAPSVEAPPCLARRYRLMELIGHGGQGEVWRAHDELNQELVAVKLLRTSPERDLARVRREVTALRLLRLPGVVPLRDDGLEGDLYFLAMDLIDGAPFPGPGGAVAWRELAPVAVGLLEVLARVHHAGVVHGDLKPPNVLIRRDGLPVVLDFGVATGAALSPRMSALGLTALYAAPEQLQGLPADPRADLYAVGVMLFEALTGRRPHGDERMVAVRRRLSGEIPSLGAVGRALPSEVRRALESLLALSPQDRPASAVEALALLGGDALALLEGRSVEQRARVECAEPLRRLFRGPDPFHHLAEDAAAALFARTGGEPRRVRQELAAWVRAGLAWWDGDQLVVERAAVDRLAAGLPLVVEPAEATLDGDAGRALTAIRAALPDARPADLRAELGWSAQRLGRALGQLRREDRCWELGDGRLGAQPVVSGRAEAAAPPRDLPAALGALKRLAEHAQAGGHLTRAAALLERGLLLARQAERQPLAVAELEADLLRLTCDVAAAEESVAALERALYTLERAVVSGDDVDAWVWLLHGLRAAWRSEPERALELLDALPPLADGELESWRQAGRVRAAEALGEAASQQVLEGLAAWAAGHEAREARLAGWWGNLRYRQGRYAEAVELHLQSARRKRRADARLASLVNASMAALETLDNARARALGEEAVEIAAALRHPGHEAAACWVLRHASYRAGVPLAPRPDLVEAAAPLGAWYEGVHASSEAVIAWRAGELGLAIRLARRAARCFHLARQVDMAALMEALALALGGAPDPRGPEALADPTLGGEVPDLLLQRLSLLHLSASDPPRAWTERVRALARCRSSDQWSARLDVLSIHEALEVADRRRWPD